MATAKLQHCDYCGEELGVYVHVRSTDGPRVCGSLECNRDATNDERAEREHAMLDAIDDDFWRYR